MPAAGGTAVRPRGELDDGQDVLPGEPLELDQLRAQLDRHAGLRERRHAFGRDPEGAGGVQLEVLTILEPVDDQPNAVGTLGVAVVLGAEAQPDRVVVDRVMRDVQLVEMRTDLSDGRTHASPPSLGPRGGATMDVLKCSVRGSSTRAGCSVQLDPPRYAQWPIATRWDDPEGQPNPLNGNPRACPGCDRRSSTIRLPDSHIVRVSVGLTSRQV